MLSRASFDVFTAPTLATRLGRIQQEVDPDFEVLGQQLVAQLQPALGQPLHLHIAKHLRRHKNPPVDTWLALSTNARGYKMTPHFEVGLWPDRLFITLDLLAEMDQRVAAATWLAAHQVELTTLAIPQLNNDHTTGVTQPFNGQTLAASIERYQQVKKADLVFGRWVLATDLLFAEPEKVDHVIKQQLQILLPLYRDLVQVTTK